MLIFLCNDYSLASKTAKDLFVNNKLESIAVETEYGDHTLDEKNEGIIFSLNHHQVEEKRQPSLAFELDEVRNSGMRYDNFIISHIDVDTIFGIGFMSGILPCKNDRIQRVARLVSEIDEKGIHGVNIPADLVNTINCIYLIVRGIKNFKEFLPVRNVSQIIKKTLLRIKDLIYDPNKAEARYNQIKGKMPKFEVLSISTKEVSAFDKRYNNFMDNPNNIFCLNYSGSISVFGRSDKKVKEIFPDGLVPIIQEYFGKDAGGKTSAVGSGRKTNYTRKKYLEFVAWFIKRVEQAQKVGK